MYSTTRWEGDSGTSWSPHETDTERWRSFSSVQFSSFQLLSHVPTLFDPMNRSTPGLPVHHQLLRFTQTHVHRVSDTIQPSHPLPSPSPPAPNPSQHQSLFQWVTLHMRSTGVSALASFLPKNTQGWSPLGWTGWISLQSKGLSQCQIQTNLYNKLFKHWTLNTDILKIHSLNYIYAKMSSFEWQTAIN